MLFAVKQHCNTAWLDGGRCTTQLPRSADDGTIITTLPLRLLYLIDLAEVNKIVVTVVPGGGVGMRLFR